MTPKAQLNEIFSSIQGEGLQVGERHLFVRFSGCNLSCQYCDTPAALSLSPELNVEQTPGQGDFKKVLNPLDAGELIQIIVGLNQNARLHKALALSGGEPLLQIDFLVGFLDRFKKEVPLKILLETNGTLPQHLKEAMNYIDIIAMDLKLPSVSGQSFYIKEHGAFLKEAYSSKALVYVKLPIARAVKTKEIDEAAALVSGISEEIPLILQPITPIDLKKEQLLTFQAVALRKLKDVRIIPQMHKLLKML